MIWAFAAPLGALVFFGPRQAVLVFAGYVALAVFSGIIDPSWARCAPGSCRGGRRRRGRPAPGATWPIGATAMGTRSGLDVPPWHHWEPNRP
jgi:hypothetical protein